MHCTFCNSSLKVINCFQFRLFFYFYKCQLCLKGILISLPSLLFVKYRLVWIHTELFQLLLCFLQKRANSLTLYRQSWLHYYSLCVNRTPAEGIPLQFVYNIFSPNFLCNCVESTKDCNADTDTQTHTHST